MASNIPTAKAASCTSCVWISSFLEPDRGSGVERFINLITDILKEEGFDVRVIDSTQVFKSELLRKLRPLSAFKIGRTINRLCSDDDIIICNGYFSWNARRSRSLVVYHGSEAGRAKNVDQESKRLTDYAVGTVGAFLDKKSGKGRVVVAVSKATGDEVTDYYGHRIDAIVPNAVDLRVFKPVQDKESIRKKLGLPIDRFLLLYVGPPSSRKGVEWIIRELRPKLNNDTQLILRTEVSEVPEGTVVVGRLPAEQLIELYQSCDALVLPTLYEGCSFTIIEALACGLPVITSPIGGALDIQKDELLRKYIVPDRNVDGYIKCVQSLKSSPHERDAVSLASRQFAEKHHDIENFRESYRKIINHLAGD